MDRETAEFINGLKPKRALTFINKIRRKLNYIQKEENYFDGVFFDFRSLNLYSKEEFLELKYFMAYALLNNLSVDQIIDLAKFLEDKEYEAKYNELKNNSEKNRATIEDKDYKEELIKNKKDSYSDLER